MEIFANLLIIEQNHEKSVNEFFYKLTAPSNLLRPGARTRSQLKFQIIIQIVLFCIPVLIFVLIDIKDRREIG